MSNIHTKYPQKLNELSLYPVPSFNDDELIVNLISFKPKLDSQNQPLTNLLESYIRDSMISFIKFLIQIL